MQWDVLRGLGILSEALRKPLRDCSGCTNVFRLGEESGCPDLVAFLKRFIREVGFQVGKLLRCRLGFVFLVGIFYEGWEGASPAGVYLFGVLPSCVPVITMLPGSKQKGLASGYCLCPCQPPCPICKKGQRPTRVWTSPPRKPGRDKKET